MAAVTIARLPKNGTEEVRVTLDAFKGANLADMRVFADFTSAGIAMPTKKGLSVRIEQLPDLIDALEKAREEAVAIGWLE